MKITRRLLTLPIAVVVCAAVICMVMLGFWQLDRMHEKEQRLASIAQKSADGAMTLRELDPRREDIRDFLVGFNGKADTEKLLYLDNQVENGQVGYDVIVPVVSNEGIVLVNYGWVKAPLFRGTLPAVDIAPGFQHFHGRINVPSENPVVRETLSLEAPFPAVIQALDIGFISRLTQMKVAPFVVELTAPAQSNFVRNWQPVVMPPQKHLGYAIQWFGLAVAAAVVSYFSFRANNKG
ncbi:SURF1 family protein [Aestuariibacter sp. A3R04]|nr:SURF1 family protein [Aestuariibacter sp. A3R04]